MVQQQEMLMMAMRDHPDPGMQVYRPAGNGPYHKKRILLFPRNLRLSMNSRGITEDGHMYSFIALIAAVILISLAMFTLLIHPSYYTGETAYSSMRVLTDDLALAGHVMGYADIQGPAVKAHVLQSPQTRPGLTMARLNLRLATLRMNWEPGTGDDLSRATVLLITPEESEYLPRRTSSPFARPGWTISRKGGRLPGTTADADEILEPNEEFSIVVSPSVNLQPGTPFSVIISIPDVRPFTLNRTVPLALGPVMDLG